jgi:SPASM domain peptide maturase of grasp-with-spasm system
MVDTGKYLIRLSNCIFVDGARRSIVCDLQRNCFDIIPKDLSRIVSKYQGKKIIEVYQDHGSADKEILDEYFDFLVENEYIFLSDHEGDAKRFLPADIRHETYHQLYHAIIDISRDTDLELGKIVSELDQLNCESVLLRFPEYASMDQIISIAALFNETQIRNIEIIIPFYNEAMEYNFETFFLEYQRVGKLVLYNSPVNSTKEFLFGHSTLKYTSFDFLNNKHCGAVDTSFFCPNILHFNEAHFHNTCLNRKIAIDTCGNIRNCPSMKETYGNIQDIKLAEAIEKPGFKKFWDITKDQIEVCRNCEYRYICSDCRAYLEDPENIYSKPSKCGYNPFTFEWVQ